MFEFEIYLDGRRKCRIMAVDELDARIRFLQRGDVYSKEALKRVAAVNVTVDELYYRDRRD